MSDKIVAYFPIFGVIFIQSEHSEDRLEKVIEEAKNEIARRKL